MNNNDRFNEADNDDLDDQKHLTHTKKLGNLEFQAYCKSQQQTAHLMFSIEKYLSAYPSFYYQSILMINKGRSIQRIKKQLSAEYNKLINGKSFYHLVINAMNSRYKCLSKIRGCLTKASTILKMFKRQYQPTSKQQEKDLDNEEYIRQVEGFQSMKVQQGIEDSLKRINEIFLDISRLRDMSLYIVETVHKWKLSLEEWTDKCGQYQLIQFFYNDNNVLESIESDSSFIWQSSLKYYIFIQSQNDPFLIRNVLKVQERQQKNILEKYFVQIVYPRSEEVVTKAIKCQQMLNFVYKPKPKNMFQEQEQLIESYLNLQKKQLEQQGVKKDQLAQIDQAESIRSQKSKTTSKTVPHKNDRGAFFGKTIKAPSSQRIKQIVQKHQVQMNSLKPFNITNYSQRKTLAMQYLAKSQYTSDPTLFERGAGSRSARIPSSAEVNHKKQEPVTLSNQKTPNTANTRTYSSHTKLAPVIFQNPAQEQKIDSPINKKPQEKNYFSSNESGLMPKVYKRDKYQRKAVSSKKFVQSDTQKDSKSLKNPIKIKFNTFSGNLQHSPLKNKNNTTHLDQQKKKELLQLKKNMFAEQDQEIPINFQSFLATFRADTRIKTTEHAKDQQKKKREKSIQQNQQKLSTVRKLLNLNRKRNEGQAKLAKRSSTSKSKTRSPMKNQRQLSKVIFSKGDIKKKSNKTQNSENRNKILKQSTQKQKDSQVKKDNDVSKQEDQVVSKSNFQAFSNQFIIIKPKTVPSEILPDFVRHIFSQMHTASKKFTLFQQSDLLSKLQDPYTHCIIFEVSTEERGGVGQIILSQNLISGSILRVAQELLQVTPCNEITFSLMEDQFDPISMDFVNLLENALKSRVETFQAKLTVSDRRQFYNKGSEIHEKLYIIQLLKKKPLMKNTILTKNYRSLKFSCRSLMLSSNFKIRTKLGTTSMTSQYLNCSVGYLYRKVLQKIMTKSHIRQIKHVLNSQPQTQNIMKDLTKQNSFLCTQISVLNQYLKNKIANQKDFYEDDGIFLNKYSSLSQFQAYIEFKQYAQIFKFNFLEDSGYILNQELLLAEFQIDFSLDMMVRSSADFLILQSNHNNPIKMIEPNRHSKAKAVILPTTHEYFQLIVIDGRQYQFETSKELDLFSYLNIYQRTSFETYTIKNDLKQIVIPKFTTSLLSSVRDLSSHPESTKQFKQFEGLSKLFPEKQFYSGIDFSCTNLWQSFFPSAVIYEVKNSKFIQIFEYPLIIGFLHKKTNEIINAVLLKENVNERASKK